MALFDLFGIGQAPDYMSSIMDEEQRKRLQQQATADAMINFGLNALQQGGYSRVPVGLGQIIGSAGQAAMKGYDQTMEQGLQNALMKQKLDEMKKQKEIAARRQAFIESIGKPNAVRQVATQPTEQVPVAPMDGAVAPNFQTQMQPPVITEEKYYSPEAELQAALNSGAIDYKDFLTLASKEKKPRETFVAPDGSIRYKDTAELASKENVAAPVKRETYVAPNGSIRYRDTGEIARPENVAAPKEGKALYSSSPVATDKGYVYFPTAEGMAKKMPPISADTGSPIVGTVNPASTSKPTEDQSKATGWFNQADNAWKNMQNVMYKKDAKGNVVRDAAGNPQLITDIIQPKAGESLAASVGFSEVAGLQRSGKRQQFVQATESLSEALLRAATGAGVNKDEAAQKIRELTPTWSDKPENIRQKMDSIPVYLQSLKSRAGMKQTPAAASGGWKITEVTNNG